MGASVSQPKPASNATCGCQDAASTTDASASFLGGAMADFSMAAYGPMVLAAIAAAWNGYKQRENVMFAVITSIVIFMVLYVVLTVVLTPIFIMMGLSSGVSEIGGDIKSIL